MTTLSETLPRNEVRALRGADFVRGMNRLLPLGRKYCSLIRVLNGSDGLAAVPFGPYSLILPAAWTKSLTQLLLSRGVVAEFELLKPLCRSLPPGLLIDAGANIGLYTLLLRSVSSLPIIAYEPQPLLHKLLRWNIANNNLPKVETRNIALGSGPDEVPFWLGLNGSVLPAAAMARKPNIVAPSETRTWEEEVRLANEGRNAAMVRVTTLDDDLADQPSISLLKIDCEGFECEILRGASALIQRHRPLLFIEVHPEELRHFNHSTQDVLDLIPSDYDLEFWYFRMGRYTSKFAHSLAKFRKPKGHRCANTAEMLAAANTVPGPAQIYLVGHPRRKH